MRMNVWTDDASSLADAVRQREVRAADVLEASLEAIRRSKLNTVVTLDAEGARRQTETIDERLERGEDPGLWAGVPLLVKDMEDAAGMPTSYGSLVFKENIAERDSTHVERLRAAGAVIVGKAATSEFGFVAYTSTKLHGVTRNPWNLERTPAGSSGGPAAAVSGGLVPTATAGDGGGSIRIPASYCGLVGMKGTFGRIPRGPHTDYGQLAAVKGTVARSVRDAARWYDVTLRLRSARSVQPAARRRLGREFGQERPKWAAGSRFPGPRQRRRPSGRRARRSRCGGCID